MNRLCLFSSCVAFAAIAACDPFEAAPQGSAEIAQTRSELRSDRSTALPGGQIEVTDAISGDTTWTTGNTYLLKAHIFVQAGTLTIQPGVTVLGDRGSSLVITRDARINAVGTAAAPIVFTSARPTGSRKPGDWGGVVLLGRAPINVAGGETYIEGFQANTDERTKYGGTDAAHDCGKLKYTRIEFAGFKLVNNNELNGLTTGACGTGTEIDFVQVHKGADDGVEMFGGTADLKHVLVTQPDDDGLDWDFGYSGRVQFLIVQQDAEVGNNGIEADNNPTNKDAAPRSSPELWNVTLIGSPRPAGSAVKSTAMLLRNGTAGKIRNAIVAHFPDAAIDVDGAESVAAYNAGELLIQNSVFWNLKGDTVGLPAETKDNDNGFDEAAKLLEAQNGNRVADPMLAAAQNLNKPSFKPRAGSPALVGGATPPGLGFDPTASFVGAIGARDWTTGWTAFPAN
jgi:hypothetical protein